MTICGIVSLPPISSSVRDSLNLASFRSVGTIRHTLVAANPTQAPPSVRVNVPTSALRNDVADRRQMEDTGRQTWSDTAQRQRGPLPLPPTFPGQSSDLPLTSASHHKSRGNEIFDTIKHVPVGSTRPTGLSGTAAAPGSGHARDRAAHGTEMHREATLDMQSEQPDILEHSPPATESGNVPQPSSPLQSVSPGMDDMMLDSVIIPALDNVSRPVKFVDVNLLNPYYIMP